MSLENIIYDPFGDAPSNYIIGEEQPITTSVAVVPLGGCFFTQDFEMEGMVDGEWLPLRREKDYLFSPLNINLSAKLAKEAVSYVVLLGTYTNVKYSYRAVGGDYTNDIGLFNKIQATQFDRLDPIAWLAFTGSERHVPEGKEPYQEQTSEIALFSDALARISKQLNNLIPFGGGKVSNIEFTGLELRQSELEDTQGTVLAEFDQIEASFNELSELVNLLRLTVETGGTTGSSEGTFVHVDTPEETANNNLIHNLETPYLEVSVWKLDATLRYVLDPTPGVSIVSDNEISVPGTEAKIVVVRTPLAGYTHTYESTGVAQQHLVEHNLDSNFLTTTLWVNNNGLWSIQSPEVVATTNNLLTVNLPSASNIRVLVSKPIPSGFLYVSPSPRTVHRIAHGLDTTHINLSAWEKTIASTYANTGATARVVSRNVIEVITDTPVVIRALLQPLLGEAEQGGQNYQQLYIELSVDQEQINDRLIAVEQGFSIVNPFQYQSDAPLLNHTVEHNLNTSFIETAVWVESDSAPGQFSLAEVNVVGIDDNTVEVRLARVANIRVAITAL